MDMVVRIVGIVVCLILLDGGTPLPDALLVGIGGTCMEALFLIHDELRTIRKGRKG